MKPEISEPICLISYEVTQLRVGGSPAERPGFWKAYREELELNQQTQFRNYHVKVCRHHIKSLHTPPTAPVYFRAGKLATDEEGTAALLREIQ